jgi:hypothetical protein
VGTISGVIPFSHTQRFYGITVSRYIQILNTIKQNIVRLSLTQGRFHAEQILERLEYPGVLNLYGGHGAARLY